MAPPNTLPTRPLGKDGPLVPRLGLGLMGISVAYGKARSDEERLEFLTKAWEMGETFWDTANLYGDSEDLIGKWFAANPEKRKDIFLATKFGMTFTPSAGITIDTSPEHCRASIEKSLQRLGLPYVDLYYIHRLDGKTPIEKTMRVMVELKNEGKIKHIGLSEPSAASLRRAYAIHPIACVQNEYSPFCLEVETKTLETARELGVAVVAFSPLGRGILTGAIRDVEDVCGEGDMRNTSGLPWFQEENLKKNVELADRIGELAKKKGATIAQLTLAWVLAQGDDFFAIPGTKSAERLKENLGALDVKVEEEEDKEIRKLADEVAGARVMEAHSQANYADTPLEE